MLGLLATLYALPDLLGPPHLGQLVVDLSRAKNDSADLLWRQQVGLPSARMVGKVAGVV